MSSRPPGPDSVSVDQLERRLGELAARVDDPRAGLFGPDSKLWEVNREAVLFLGGGRAALLQLAHPFVARGIAQHSRTESDPWGRFRRTFRAVFAMIFGDLEAASEASRRVHGVHRRIAGRLGQDLGVHRAGTAYHANHREALLWVHATLWDTSVLVFETVVRRLTDDEKEQYYQETRRFAALFGLEDGELPASWESFRLYVDEEIASDRLAVGDEARRLGSFLFTPRPWWSRPAMLWLRTMTAGMMPEPLRSAFGLRWERRHRRVYERSLGLLRVSRPLWPRRLREVPAYHDAERRLRRAPGRDRVGELLTRLWLGAEERSAHRPGRRVGADR